MHYFKNQGGILNVILKKDPASKAVYNEIKMKTKLYVYLFEDSNKN